MKMTEDIPLNSSLRELIHTFDQTEGEFFLVFAVCEQGPIREEMMLKLREHHPDIIELKCKEGDPSDEFFANLDLNQELVRKLECPLVFWVSKKELQSLIRNAPILYGGAITVEIEE